MPIKLFFEGFLAGLGSVLSFGWPKKGACPLRSTAKVLSEDWQRVGRDMESAISNYKLERKNDKT
ncbi:MAG: hypothetical protein K0R98_1314 [Rickettsiaceae bacterium]|jgi:hypothetical protein|nr:hypothetical protein [Rickettsiaceae bacterium]